MTATIAAQPTARQKFDALVASRTLDQTIDALALLDHSTAEGLMVRVALIDHVEKVSPEIRAWVRDFYDVDDDDPRWDIDYPDAVLLARDALAS